MSYSTDWVYDTSEDTSYSLFVLAGGSGTLYLKNTTNGDKMALSYTYFGAGESKGSDIGSASSTTDMDSSGGGVVMFQPNPFGQLSFPCGGFVISGGGAGGLPGSSSGFALTEYLFGFPVFGGVRCSGTYSAALPGAGISVCAARFNVASYTEGTGAPTTDAAPDDPGSTPDPGTSGDLGQSSSDGSATG